MYDSFSFISGTSTGSSRSGSVDQIIKSGGGSSSVSVCMYVCMYTIIMISRRLVDIEVAFLFIIMLEDFHIVNIFIK